MPSNSPKYPVGTIAAYGPDNKLATKLAVSVFKRAGDKEPVELHRWFTNGGDVRNDPAIANEVADFLKRCGVKQTVSYDRIIGCPHEEGKDYPLGGTCPHCPFWRNIDRFTHEPISNAPATMTPEQILRELSVVRKTQPREALAAADAQREALVGPLLRAVERGLENPTDLPEGEGMLFSYATYLLAKWREPRAYPLFIRWLSLPGEAAFDLGGDTATQEGAMFLAMVCGGDLEPIKALILNREANEFCRGVAVGSLARLAAWDEVPREQVVDYFRWLSSEGLEREHSFVWNDLACACANIEALPVFPELRRAFDEGLIDEGVIRRSELDEVEAAPGSELGRYKKHHPPITDVADEIRWWGCFEEELFGNMELDGNAELDRIAELDGIAELDSNAERLALMARDRALFEPKPDAPPIPYKAPPKAGRNDPCPCGSGKKFKKCCGR